MITEPQPRFARRVLLAAVFHLAAAASLLAADLKPETVASFNHYVQLSEQGMANEAGLEFFLWIDSLPAQQRDEEYGRLREGQVITERLETREDGKPIPVPDGLIHHWVGTVFIPGASLQQVLAFLQDYDHQSNFYQPEVQRSKLLERNGNHFKIFLRLHKTKVVTVALNTEYDVDYTLLDASHAASRSYSTRIAEVENAGESDEREKPVGYGSGFMWRLNSYWRFQQRDGGTYVQLEAISLTRDIPTGLGWLIRPFITGIPQESLVFTLSRTRDGLANRSLQ